MWPEVTEAAVRELLLPSGWLWRGIAGEERGAALPAVPEARMPSFISKWSWTEEVNTRITLLSVGSC